jgi:hypothetical protein
VNRVLISAFLSVCQEPHLPFKALPTAHLVLSYMALRRAIGVLGSGLPLLLALGKMLLQGPGLEHSISAYYYTAMGDVLVGSLCAIGVFLLSYQGYERADQIAGRLACVSAVGVALFPVAPAQATAAQLRSCASACCTTPWPQPFS